MTNPYILLRKLIRKEIKNIIRESAGGDESGKLEIHTTDVNDAINYTNKTYDIDIETIIPEFKRNYLYVQKLTNLGKTKRRDMPVITSDDVKQFQHRLSKGFIDITAPYSDATNTHNPFPEGLSGKQAEYFLINGLRDGDKLDDKVGVSKRKIKVGKLKPIQKQIYFDLGITFITRYGVKNAINFLTQSTIFIASSDNFIIDGHHRFLAGNLINPNMNVTILAINLPLKQLLPMAIAYGDAIGNKRNG